MPTIELGDTQLYYDDRGEQGIPLVLLHPFPFDASSWDELRAALSPTQRTIAVDLEGFGNSALPPPSGTPSMARYAAQVDGLLAARGIERAAICGLSMGGYVALALHRNHRGRVAGLVLADTRAEADTAEGKAKRKAQREAIEAGKIEALGDELMGPLLGATTRHKRPELVARTRTRMSLRPQGVSAALAAMASRPDAMNELSKIEVPALVIVGDEDLLTPPPGARSMADRIPSSRYVVLENAGHLAHLEQPQAFARELERFLKTLQ